jgi:hypothetical protein
MHKFMKDAQQALAFIQTQATHIEGEVDKIEYPEVQYPDLIPVDYSAPEWIKSITYYSQDRVGKADWFNHLGRDVPRADVDRAKFETGVEMAAIGYGYTVEELAQADMMNVSLTPDKADAAREAYEEFVDDVALYGNVTKGFYGLISYPGVAAINAPADGTGASRAWANKTPVQIARDINLGLTGVWTDTKQIGMANTVLLPPEQYSYIVTTMFDPNGNQTILDWIEKTNIYTKVTGQKLLVRSVRGLETAGSGGSARMVIYKRDPKVLKMHIPMRHKFLEPMRTGPLLYEIPGIFRLGGLDVKRPAYIRYIDMIA